MRAASGTHYQLSVAPKYRGPRDAGRDALGVRVCCCDATVCTCPSGIRVRSLIYEWPSLELVRALTGATEAAYAALTFSGKLGSSEMEAETKRGAEAEGGSDLLASVGSAPDYLLTLWDWQVGGCMRARACLCVFARVWCGVCELVAGQSKGR